MYVCVCVCFKIEVKFTQYAVHDLKACGSVVAVRVLSPSVVFDSATLWTAARQAPLSMGFSRQEDWSGLPFPSPRDLPNPGIKPRFPVL